MDGDADATNPRRHSYQGGSFEIGRRNNAIIGNLEDQVISAILLRQQRVQPFTHVPLGGRHRKTALDQLLRFGGQALAVLASTLGKLTLELRLDVTDQQVRHQGSFDINDIKSPPSRLLRLPLRRLGELLDHTVALELGDMVDEQHAVEVVDLVLQHRGEQAVRLDLVRLAVEVGELDLHLRGPLDLLV